MHAHVVHTYLTSPSMWNFNNTSEYHASVHFRSQRGSWTILTTFSLPLMAKNLLNWGPPVNKGNKMYFQNFDKIQKNVITVIFYLRINKTSTLWFGDVVAWCREVFNAPFTGKVGVFPPFYYLAFLLGPGGLASNLAEDVVFGAVDILEVVKGHIFSKLRWSLIGGITIKELLGIPV